MKHIVFVAALFLATFASCATVPKKVVEAHKASHQISQQVIFAGGSCTATAIGPQALLTATHCELPTDTLYVDDADATVTIVGRIRDERDHTIYLLKNVHFTEYVEVSLNDPLEAGEDVFVWGNPGEWKDQLRKGYITGTLKGGLFSPTPNTTQFDLNGYFGDSGAGVMNSDGKVIAVLSVVNMQGKPESGVAIKFMGAFSMGFTQAQIDSAKAFSVADDPKKQEDKEQETP